VQRGLTFLLAFLGVGVVLCAGVIIAAWFLGSPAKGLALAQAIRIPRPAVIAHRGASYRVVQENESARLARLEADEHRERTKRLHAEERAQQAKQAAERQAYSADPILFCGSLWV
jgi:hypothetical protein